MINIIAAISENNVIGNNGNIPWRLPGDFARFKHLTMDKNVVMGRKTYESLFDHMKDRAAEPLKGRNKIVLTNDPAFKTPYCTVILDWLEIKRRSEAGEEFWIMGGGKIYELFMPITDFLYLTQVRIIAKGDTFFPKWNGDEWEWAYDPLNAIVEPHPKDEYKWDILDLHRIRP
jgi:dihydrofolate reductase